MYKIENQIGLQIVLMFLDKLEKMTEEERHEILKTIKLLNNPVFVSN